jgi:type IV pilus assembly protein PilN
MKDIDKFKQQKATLAKKMEVIKTLEKNKSGPVRMLDQIASCLPGNIWLTELEQKDKTLTIDGRTSDNISISRYMLNLEASPNFQGVTLGEIKTDKRRKGSSSLRLKTFKLSSGVTYVPKSKTPPAS